MAAGARWSIIGRAQHFGKSSILHEIVGDRTIKGWYFRNIMYEAPPRLNLTSDPSIIVEEFDPTFFQKS